MKNLLPVVNYAGVYPLNPHQLQEWSVLDTFAMLSPAHDHPQKLNTLRKWFEHAGIKQIETFRSGFFVGRGIK